MTFYDDSDDDDEDLALGLVLDRSYGKFTVSLQPDDWTEAPTHVSREFEA